MKKLTNKISLMVTGIMLAVCVSAFASEAVNDQQSSTALSRGKVQYEQLTEEQKAELQAKRDEMIKNQQERQTKWEALTEEQKQEVYSIVDESVSAKVKLIDKYLELGLITADEATELKNKINEKNTEMKNNKSMPGIKNGKGCRNGKFGSSSQQTTTTEQSSSSAIS